MLSQPQEAAAWGVSAMVLPGCEAVGFVLCVAVGNPWETGKKLWMRGSTERMGGLWEAEPIREVSAAGHSLWLDAGLCSGLSGAGEVRLPPATRNTGMTPQ